jgi:hypothetical protein
MNRNSCKPKETLLSPQLGLRGPLPKLSGRPMTQAPAPMASSSSRIGRRLQAVSGYSPSSPKGSLSLDARMRRALHEPSPRRDVARSSSAQKRHQISLFEQVLALIPWNYIRSFIKWSTVLFIALNVLWCSWVIAIGNGHMIPNAYLRVSQHLYQGLHCDFTNPQPEDWTKCR